MHATKGTPDATRFLDLVRLSVSSALIIFAQITITGFVGFFVVFLPFLSSSYSPGSLLTGMKFLIAGFAFALLWLGYWWMMYSLSGNGRIRGFFLLLLTSYLTLIFICMQIDPVYNPEAMIPGSARESTFLVCMAMSAILLFPFYSLGVYTFVLKPVKRPRKRYRFLLLCLLFAVAGLVLLPFLWHFAPVIYPGLRSFPE